ncbi:MAG: glycine cleavage system aminomethyltransferase GcvT [Parvularculaceae bacterium]
MTAALKQTSLHDLHLSLGAKMVEFAGYDMPVQYPDGVLKEHLWTRTKAGLFDVSHMGQAFLSTTRAALGSDEAHADIAEAIETLLPGEIRKLKKGGMRYSVLLNDEGGIMDDLMVTRPSRDDKQGLLFLVVNAACKDADFAHIEKKLAGRAKLEIAGDRSLLALQGPSAAKVLDAIVPGVATQTFMTMKPYDWNGVFLIVSRCGYTGEDGFEVSVPDDHAEKLAREMLAHPDVAPIGLGARDSLRLEAGLCLYGHDIDTTTSPVEGNIAFALGKRRKEEANFPGAERILSELADGPKRLRVGVKPEGRAPAREGTEIVDMNGAKIGVVTSGGFGPTVNGPVAMGYVDFAHSKTGAAVQLMVRGKAMPATIVDMPVVPHTYYRG